MELTYGIDIFKSIHLGTDDLVISGGFDNKKFCRRYEHVKVEIHRNVCDKSPENNFSGVLSNNNNTRNDITDESYWKTVSDLSHRFKTFRIFKSNITRARNVLKSALGTQIKALLTLAFMQEGIQGSIWYLTWCILHKLEKREIK